MNCSPMVRHVFRPPVVEVDSGTGKFCRPMGTKEKGRLEYSCQSPRRSIAVARGRGSDG